MKSELDKLTENLQFEDPYFGEWSQEIAVVFGWTRCKQKILEILKQNENTGEEPYGKNCRTYKFYLADEILEQIEKL